MATKKKPAKNLQTGTASACDLINAIPDPCARAAVQALWHQLQRQEKDLRIAREKTDEALSKANKCEADYLHTNKRLGKLYNQVNGDEE